MHTMQFSQYSLFAGIPTVKRQYQSYLVTTLQSVLDNISKVRFYLSEISKYILQLLKMSTSSVYFPVQEIVFGKKTNFWT